VQDFFFRLLCLFFLVPHEHYSLHISNICYFLWWQEEKAEKELMQKVESYPQNRQHVSGCLVGMEPTLDAVRSKLKAVVSLGLIGMGGLGKTTVAKILFNELGCNFEYTCFVPDVTLIPGSVEALTKAVWSHMCQNGKEVQGKERWSELTGKNVLLVLDDVSKERDVKPFLNIAGCFSEKSRLIATTRESGVLNPFADLYEVKNLDKVSAKILFTSYAFEA
jgi:hypothetical protein